MDKDETFFKKGNWENFSLTPKDVLE